MRLNGLRISAISNLNVERSMIGDTIILRVKPIDEKGMAGEAKSYSVLIESDSKPRTLNLVFEHLTKIMVYLLLS